MYLGQVKPFKIIATNHASQRMEERHIAWQVAAKAIQALGADAIAQRLNSKIDITVGHDRIICYAERKQVRIITVMRK